MGYISKESGESIAKDYLSGVLTNEQIAQKHGVCIRSVYNCVDRYAPIRRAKKTHDWLSVRITRDEVELALLLILKSEGLIPKEREHILRSLEEKLLRAADRDEKMNRCS